MRSSFIASDGIFLTERRMSLDKVESRSSPDMALMYNSDHGVSALELMWDCVSKMTSVAWMTCRSFS